MYQVFRDAAGVAATENLGKYPTVKAALAVASAYLTDMVDITQPGRVWVTDNNVNPVLPIAEFRSFP